MEVVQRASKWLRGVGRASEIRVVSPYVNGEGLTRLLDAIAPSAQCTIITALPLTPVSRGLFDAGALADAVESGRCRVSAYVGDERLHAKVYVADNSALVTSGNLTGPGVGADKASMNRELGVALTGDAALDVLVWLDDIDSLPVSVAQLRLLADRLTKAGRGQAFSPIALKAGDAFHAVQQAVARAAAHAGGRVLRSRGTRIHEIEVGRCGHWLSQRGSRRRFVRLRSVTSHPTGHEYHFHSNPSEAAGYWRGRLDAALFVPMGGSELATVAPVALVPYRCLFAPGRGMTVGAAKRGKFLRALAVALNGDARLRIPNSTGQSPRVAAIGELVRSSDVPGFSELLQLTRET